MSVLAGIVIVALLSVFVSAFLVLETDRARKRNHIRHFSPKRQKEVVHDPECGMNEDCTCQD